MLLRRVDKLNVIRALNVLSERENFFKKIALRLASVVGKRKKSLQYNI